MKRHKRTLAEIAKDAETWTEADAQAYARAQDDQFFAPSEAYRMHATDALLFDGDSLTAREESPNVERAERVKAMWADVVRPKLTAGQAAILDVALTLGEWSAGAIAPLTCATAGKGRGAPMKRQSVLYQMRKIEAILSKHGGEIVDSGVFDGFFARQ